MNEREIAEIRRRMRPEKNNIGHIRGCYVNTNKAIVSEFNQNLGLISNDEAEEVLSLLRKTLSGTLGRNLIEISFSNQQVLESEEHKLLSDLRASSLSDDESVKKLYQKVISSLEIDTSYLILLANDKYDVMTSTEDGESYQMFSYILCAICPIKIAKPTLGYNISENKFKNFIRDSIVSSPAIGFMFPAFEANGANIYQSLLYTQDVSNSQEAFIDTVFKCKVPKPATEQTESIASILNTTVAEECSLEFVQSVQGQLIELTSDHKTNKVEEPLTLSLNDMQALLRFGGVKEERVSDFTNNFEESFGADTSIVPINVMDIKKFEVKTPEVTIKVAPDHSDLVEARVIDGTKYLLIRADGDVEVNGVRINIKDAK